MTTADTYSKAPKAPGKFRLPDPPERHPDDMTSFKQLVLSQTCIDRYGER